MITLHSWRHNVSITPLFRVFGRSIAPIEALIAIGASVALAAFIGKRAATPMPDIQAVQSVSLKMDRPLNRTWVDEMPWASSPPHPSWVLAQTRADATPTPFAPSPLLLPVDPGPPPPGAGADPTPRAPAATTPTVVDPVARETPTRLALGLATPGGPCGATICRAGEVCCNATCGVCAAPGAACPQTRCGSNNVPTSETCGRNTCNVGEVCCNASCGTCTSPGVDCDHTRCTDGPTTPVSQSCGMHTCDVGQICCGGGCGVCVNEGEVCPAECLTGRSNR